MPIWTDSSFGMDPPTTPAPILVGRRIPKRARKIPKKTSDQKNVEKLLVMLAFAGGLIVGRFLSPVAGLALAAICGVGLLVYYIVRRARRQEERYRPPGAKTR